MIKLKKTKNKTTTTTKLQQKTTLKNKTKNNKNKNLLHIVGIGFLSVKKNSNIFGSLLKTKFHKFSLIKLEKYFL